MVRISVDEAKVGMELSCAVRAAQGFIIFPSKTKLTVKDLGIIRSWGIELIDVKSAGRKSTPKVEDDDEHLIEEMFAPHRDNKLMLAIKKSAVKRYKKKK